jgi:hypothetical protein
MLPSASKPSSHCSIRECLALRENIAAKEGDAFLARLHMPDAVLPMVDAAYRTSTLGMRLPYEQVPYKDARSSRGVPHRLTWLYNGL